MPIKRKKKEIKTFVRISKEMKERLDELAEEADVSFAMIARRAYRQFIESHQTPAREAAAS